MKIEEKQLLKTLLNIPFNNVFYLEITVSILHFPLGNF